MKTIDVVLSKESIDSAIAELSLFQEKLEAMADRAAEMAARSASMTASSNFSSAEYAGTNNVSVDVKQVENGVYEVDAEGSATLFIEFGTGVFNPDVHPEAGASGIVGHGSYGRGRGSKENGWTYVGSTGNAPYTEVIADGSSGQVVHTYGNVANMCLYNAKKEVEEDFSKYIEEAMNYVRL